MDEKRKEEIRKEARVILEKFGKSLDKVHEVKVKTEKSESYREEREPVANEDFRKRMFANAPEKDGDFLIAEKKKW